MAGGMSEVQRETEPVADGVNDFQVVSPSLPKIWQCGIIPGDSSCDLENNHGETRREEPCIHLQPLYINPLAAFISCPSPSSSWAVALKSVFTNEGLITRFANSSTTMLKMKIL